MPLGKYYCDYCDKEFQDTPAARRRHLQGVQHQRAKALWYDSLRSKFLLFILQQVLLVQVLLKASSSGISDPHSFNHPDSFGKGVCNHFVRTGYCQYGDSCKYYHPKQNSQTVNQTGIPPGENSREGFQSSSQPFGSASFPGGVFREKAGASLSNLPPSLRPPPEGGYPPLPFVDWG